MDNKKRIYRLTVNYKLKIENCSNGYIALMTVLILSGILIMVSVFFSQSEILISNFPIKNLNSVQAKEYANSCVQIALDKFLQSQTYQGNETQNFTTGGSCQILPITSNLNQYTLETTGTYNSITRKIKVIYNFNSSQISLVSWQEISDF